MNRFKKALSVLLTLTLMLSACSACGKKAAAEVAVAAPVETTAAAEAAVETQVPAEQDDSAYYYHVGDKMDDFTITTYDGKEISLYQVLEEKEMVLLNLWATWCDPCVAEFPAIQEAYEQYRDKVEVIALSVAESDSDEILADFVQEIGITFPVTRDTVEVCDRVHVSSTPTSIVVDRFGIICAIATNGSEDPATFANIFDIYTGEDYTRSIFIPSIYSQLPDVEPADPDALNAALNGEGGELVFTNSSNPFYWPMTVEQKDGRTVASASNVQSPLSLSVVETQVEAKAGEVLVLEYKLLSQDHQISLHVAVDGRDVKTTSLTKDWATYAYRFEEGGSHRITVSLEKQEDWMDGDAGLWIDSIRLVSGDEGAQALAKNPVYPAGGEWVKYTPVNESAEKFMIVDAESGEGMTIAYLCTDPVLRLAITLPEEVEPETVFLGDEAGNVISVAPCATEDGYLLEIPDDGSFDTSRAVLCSDSNPLEELRIPRSWEEMDIELKKFGDHFGRTVTVMPYDETMAMSDEETSEMPEAEGDGAYTVTYVDQNGDPVPGVMCQVCDEASCRVFVSDESGICRFELPAGIYEIHTLKVPDGYEGDTTTVTEAPVGGGELNFTLTKN